MKLSKLIDFRLAVGKGGNMVELERSQFNKSKLGRARQHQRLTVCKATTETKVNNLIQHTLTGRSQKILYLITVLYCTSTR